MDFTDDPEVRDQLLIGGNSPFSRKCNDSVTIWRILSMRQVRLAGGRAKKLKEKMHSQLPCLLSDFYPRNIRMTRNETSADRRLHPRTGDAIFFLISRVSEGPILSRVPALLAKAEKPMHEHHREFFTEGSEENKDSYLRLIPNPLSYLRFLLFSFSFCRGRPESDARTLRTPKALRAKIGKPIPLSRRGSHPPSSRSRGSSQ